MILCLPFHPAVPVDYTKVVTDLTRLAGNRSHTALVISRPSDEQAGLDLAISLSQSFGRHFHGVLQARSRTAAGAANLFFRTAMRFLKAYKPGEGEPSDTPLLYLDPMWKPRGKHWLDTLQSEWFRKGAPAVMGNPGNPEAPDFKGAVVFGRKYVETSALIDHLPDNEHWRKFLAWEMFRNAVMTESIGDTKDAVIQPRK